MTRKEKVIWAAGFIDGEGTIMIHRVANQRPSEISREFQYRVVLSAANTRREALEQLEKLFGGGVTVDARAGYQENCKTVYRWQAVCNVACAAIEEMYPYLLLKQKQADVAMKFQSMRKKGRTSANERIKNETRDSRLWGRMKTLNQRGTITVT